MTENYCFVCGEKAKYKYGTPELLCVICKPKFKDKYSRKLLNSDTYYSRHDLKILFPTEYYEDWKRRNPERIICEVRDFPINTGPLGKKFHHVRGIVNKVFFKNGKKYVILKDLKTEDEIPIILSDYFLNEIYENDVGERILVFFRGISRGGFVKPILVKYLFSSIDEQKQTKLRRQEYRMKTIYLYPSIYRKYGYKCAMCSSKNVLEIHHRNYDESNDEQAMIRTMILLCHNCHEKITSEQIKIGFTDLNKYM